MGYCILDVQRKRVAIELFHRVFTDFPILHFGKLWVLRVLYLLFACFNFCTFLSSV